MSLMVIELYDALLSAGVDREKAMAAAKAVAPQTEDDYVAKPGKTVVRSESDNSAVKSDSQK